MYLIFQERKMDSFYVTLPSNVVNGKFENRIGSYTTILPQNLHLDGKWMVGLSEISYTNSWFNILEHDYFHLLSAADPITKITQKVTFAPGRYKSLDQIISEVHNRLEKIEDNTNVAVFPKLSYDEASRRVFV